MRQQAWSGQYPKIQFMGDLWFGFLGRDVALELTTNTTTTTLTTNTHDPQDMDHTSKMKTVIKPECHL
jgi:hypothetical protein